MSILSICFNANKLGRMRSLFFRSGSSENRTPMRAPARVVRKGGWLGGDKKSPSIFLKPQYINKKNVLIPSLGSKVTYEY